MARPRNDIRHADAAFQRGALGAAQRVIARGVDCCARHGRPSVVADEADKRVLFEAELSELLRYTANGLVHRQHHRIIRASLVVGFVGELGQPRIGRLHRRVHGIKCKIEEPRLALVPLDERGGFAPESVGCIVELRHRLGAAQDAGRLKVIVGAAEETVELVEPALLRMELGLRPKVPFAHEAGDVTGGLEAVGDCPLGEWQAAVAARIELVTEPGLIPTGHQSGPRGRAIRPGDVTTGETHARRGERVEVRRGNILAPAVPTSA